MPRKSPTERHIATTSDETANDDELIIDEAEIVSKLQSLAHCHAEWLKGAAAPREPHRSMADKALADLGFTRTLPLVQLVSNERELSRDPPSEIRELGFFTLPPSGQTLMSYNSVVADALTSVLHSNVDYKTKARQLTQLCTKATQLVALQALLDALPQEGAKSDLNTEDIGNLISWIVERWPNATQILGSKLAQATIILATKNEKTNCILAQLSRDHWITRTICLCNGDNTLSKKTGPVQGFMMYGSTPGVVVGNLITTAEEEGTTSLFTFSTVQYELLRKGALLWKNELNLQRLETPGPFNPEVLEHQQLVQNFNNQEVRRFGKDRPMITNTKGWLETAVHETAQAAHEMHLINEIINDLREAGNPILWGAYTHTTLALIVPGNADKYSVALTANSFVPVHNETQENNLQWWKNNIKGQDKPAMTELAQSLIQSTSTLVYHWFDTVNRNEFSLKARKHELEPTTTYLEQDIASLCRTIKAKMMTRLLNANPNDDGNPTASVGSTADSHDATTANQDDDEILASILNRHQLRVTSERAVSQGNPFWQDMNYINADNHRVAMQEANAILTSTTRAALFKRKVNHPPKRVSTLAIKQASLTLTGGQQVIPPKEAGATNMSKAEAEVGDKAGAVAMAVATSATTATVATATTTEDKVKLQVGPPEPDITIQPYTATLAQAPWGSMNECVTVHETAMHELRTRLNGPVQIKQPAYTVDDNPSTSANKISYNIDFLSVTFSTHCWKVELNEQLYSNDTTPHVRLWETIGTRQAQTRLKHVMPDTIKRLKHSMTRNKTLGSKQRRDVVVQLETFKQISIEELFQHLYSRQVHIIDKGAPDALVAQAQHGLKFVINKRFEQQTQYHSDIVTSHSDFQEGIDRLTRALAWQAYFAKVPEPKRAKKGVPYDKQFYIRTGNWPSAKNNHDVQEVMRLKDELLKDLESSAELSRSLHLHRDNVNPAAIKAAKYHLKQGEWIVVPTDKNLGPAIMKADRYHSLLKAHFEQGSFDPVFIAYDHPRLLALEALETTPSEKEVLTALEKVEIDSTKMKISLANSTLCKAKKVVKEFRQLTQELQQWNSDHPLTQKIMAANAYLQKEYHDESRQADNVRIPQAYGLFKAHKKKPALRVITPNITGPTKALSQALTPLLKMLTTVSPKCWTDANEAKRCIEAMTVNIEDRASFKLILFDIVSMYPNIPQNEAIEAVLQLAQSQFEDLNASIAKHVVSVLRHGLKVVLKEGHVANGLDVFKAKTKGIPMGTAIAPLVAMIFLISLYRPAIVKASKINRFNPAKDLFGMYLDDGTWGTTLPTEECLAIIKDMLSYGEQPTQRLDFTYEVIQANTANDRGPMLDILLKLDDRFLATGKISFSLYAKPMSMHDYIPPCSGHPEHTFKGVIKAETIRALKNADSQHTFKQNKRLIRKWFLNRGYDPKLVNQVMNSVQWEQRKNYMTAKPVKDPRWVPERIPKRKEGSILVLPYSKSITKASIAVIKQTIARQPWPESVKNKAQNVIMAWRRGQSVQSMLCKHKLSPEQHMQRLFKQIKGPTRSNQQRFKPAKYQGNRLLTLLGAKAAHVAH